MSDIEQVDQETPLLRSNKPLKAEMAQKNILYKASYFLDNFNFNTTRKPWRLFEICDLSICPPFLRSRCQSMLAAQWTHRLPIVQRQMPADLAAALITRSLDEMDTSASKLTVIDFCSGGGGPVPVIEKLVNQKRAARGQDPIPFLLTDISPHLDAWMDVSSKSDNLSFVPQSVDATNPPVSVISETSTSNNPSAEFSSDTRVFRLYCLAFHHFNDEMAIKTLKSTLQTSDGFAIIELQDRRVYSLIVMVLDFFLVLAVTPFWFWRDPLRLLFTYIVPALPFILSFDGFVSALRTRTFEEVMSLTAKAMGESELKALSQGPRKESKYAEGGNWIFKGGREIHTVPLGYMNWIVGMRTK